MKSAMRSPGFTPAKATTSAGLRAASRSLSAAGRAGSATAARMAEGIPSASQAREAPTTVNASETAIDTKFNFIVRTPFRIEAPTLRVEVHFNASAHFRDRIEERARTGEACTLEECMRGMAVGEVA